MTMSELPDLDQFEGGYLFTWGSTALIYAAEGGFPDGEAEAHAIWSPGEGPVEPRDPDRKRWLSDRPLTDEELQRFLDDYGFAPVESEPKLSKGIAYASCISIAPSTFGKFDGLYVGDLPGYTIGDPPYNPGGRQLWGTGITSITLPTASKFPSKEYVHIDAIHSVLKLTLGNPIVQENMIRTFKAFEALRRVEA